MAEQFNYVAPLFRDDTLIAEIEKAPQYARNFGEVWLDSGWFTVTQARELRDWLNRVIP